MEKLQIQNMGLPQYPKILYTEHCVYFSDNRALPQVLTCGKRIVIANGRTTVHKTTDRPKFKH
ncbi:MAG: hypothetical protein IPL98_01770 [Saprospiraceae bacterium]|nr:hypothetical protein [Saprospiraceae bacterium]